MKKIIFILLIAGIWSCSGPQEPIFLRLENIKATNISTKNITITGEAVFHNPNAISGTLTATNIDVINNNVDIAKIAQKQDIKLPVQAEFKVPLSFDTSPKELFEKEGKSILGGVISALLNRTVKLNYKGIMKCKFAGISFNVPLDIEQEVKL